MTVKMVASAKFVNFHKTVFLAKLWFHNMEAKYCAITVLFRLSPEISPKKDKNAGFNGVFLV